MRSVRSASLALLGIVLSGSVSVAAQTIEVLGIHYPPYLNQHAPQQSLIVPVLGQWLARSGRQLKVVHEPLPRIQLRVQAGQWCASLVNPLSTRDQVDPGVVKIPYTDKKIEHKLYRLREDKHFEWQQLAELRGLRIALLRSRWGEGQSAQMQAAGLQVIDVNNVEQAYKMLLNTRVDLIFSDEQALDYMASALGFDATQLQPSQNTLFTSRAGVWLNLACEDASALNRWYTEHALR